LLRINSKLVKLKKNQMLSNFSGLFFHLPQLTQEDNLIYYVQWKVWSMLEDDTTPGVSCSSCFQNVQTIDPDPSRAVVATQRRRSIRVTEVRLRSCFSCSSSWLSICISKMSITVEWSEDFCPQRIRISTRKSFSHKK
jgi:hypothetical protein